jgi:hypothetical protein
MFALRFQSVESGFWQSACGCDSNTRFPIVGHRPPGSGTTRQQNNRDDKTFLQQSLVVLSLVERRQNYQFEDKRKSPEQLRLSKLLICARCCCVAYWASTSRAVNTNPRPGGVKPVSPIVSYQVCYNPGEAGAELLCLGRTLPWRRLDKLRTRVTLIIVVLCNYSA